VGVVGTVAVVVGSGTGVGGGLGGGDTHLGVDMLGGRLSVLIGRLVVVLFSHLVVVVRVVPGREVDSGLLVLFRGVGNTNVRLGVIVVVTLLRGAVIGGRVDLIVSGSLVDVIVGVIIGGINGVSVAVVVVVFVRLVVVFNAAIVMLWTGAEGAGADPRSFLTTLGTEEAHG